MASPSDWLRAMWLLLPLLLLRLPLMTTLAGGSAPLPARTYVVHSALWHLAIGEPPQEDVLTSITTPNDCGCLVRCLSREDCLSFSHVAAEQNCTMYRVRGNADSPRPQRIRYRGGLAYLGDWCGSDADCSLLTGGEGVCRQNTCSCPDGRFPITRSTCGDTPTTVSTTSVESTTAATTTVASTTASSSTSPTTPDPSTALTTSTADPTTEDPSTAPTAPTAAPSSTTTTAPTTMPTPPTTTAPSSTTTTAPTDTMPMPETATTTSTTSVATTAAPDVVYIQKNQKDNQVNSEYHMDCKQDTSLNMVMVGLKDDPVIGSVGTDLDQTNCAKFLHLSDMVIGNKESRIAFSSAGTVQNACAAGSVLVSLIAVDETFRQPLAMQCAPVEGPYQVDASDCQNVQVTAAAMHSYTDTQCPQLPHAAGIVAVFYGRSDDGSHTWKGIKCCRIKPAP